MQKDYPFLLAALPCSFPKNLPKRIINAWYQALMHTTDLRCLLRFRLSPGAENYMDATFIAERVAALFAQHTSDCLEAIRNALTDEEMYCLGESFDELCGTGRNEDAISCIYARIQTVQNPEWKETLQQWFDKTQLQYKFPFRNIYCTLR